MINIHKFFISLSKYAQNHLPLWLVFIYKKMSDQIKHECGIGIIRLLKPLAYYHEKYGSALWGLRKMYLLLEKMRNRGQDGAGFGCIKLDMPPGMPYHARIRETESPPLNNLFKKIDQPHALLKQKYPDSYLEPDFLKKNYDYAGEVMIGHLRYGTHGGNNIAACHPVSRMNNWQNRSLMVAGNFNMTNVGELIDKLVELGQHPRYSTDTETVLEKIGHFLDEENKELYAFFKAQGYADAKIADLISQELDMCKVFERSAKVWDGGYVMGGLVGNGDAFIARDPSGIRPCFFYYDDEFLVAASERATIATVFNLAPEVIQELPPAHILTVKAHNNQIQCRPFIQAREKKSCSFERIYFSRGTDKDIYQERKNLGKFVIPKILEAINFELENTVFSFIPNTAEIAFHGMVEELQEFIDGHKIEAMKRIGPNASVEEIRRIINQHPRVEKVIVKDAKMRTFIADDDSRSDLVSHVYDITPGVIVPYIDNLVCIDDSIVRGTTLNKSILKILGRLNPKKIVIVSSSPQIRYPDCYGIDMAQIGKLIAFQAAIALLNERNMNHIIKEAYDTIIAMKEAGTMHERNVVKDIYAPFTEDEISTKIAEILSPVDFPIPVEIVYQPLENLAKAIPNHRGDWYFSGDYPTPGGTKVSNQAFLYYYEKKDIRAYQMTIF